MGIFDIISIVRAIFTWKVLFVLILSMAVLVPAMGVSYSQVPDVTPPVSTITLTGTAGWVGWFTSNVTVTLEATDDVSGVNRIKYSLDDGQNWSRYDGPFNVTEEGITTVLFRARDNAGNREDVKRQDVYIDRTIPTINCTVDGIVINGWYVDDAMVTLNASDDISGIDNVYYSANGSSWVRYDSPFTVNGESDIALYYNASDKAGNGYNNNTTFKVDSMIPVSWHEINGISGNDGWYVTSVVILLNGSDNGSGLSYLVSRWNGGEWTRQTGSQQFEGDSVVHYEYRAVDNVGHIGDTRCFDFRSDVTAPVTACVTEGVESMPEWYISNVTVRLTGADGTSGVACTDYSLDNVTWVAYEGPFVVSGQGLKTVYYRSSDRAGNLEDVKNATFVIDTMPPVVMGTVPADGARAASLDCLIRITFSEPMDPASMIDAIEVKDWYGFAVPGTLTYSGLTATFDPVQNLGPDFRYYVTVSNDVRDISGIHMVADHSWSFKATGVPQVQGTFIPSSVTSSPTPAPTPVPSPSPTPTPSPCPSPTPTSTPLPTPTSEPTLMPSTTSIPVQDDSSPIYLGLLILFMGIVALSGAAIYLVMFKKP